MAKHPFLEAMQVPSSVLAFVGNKKTDIIFLFLEALHEHMLIKSSKQFLKYQGSSEMQTGCPAGRLQTTDLEGCGKARWVH